MNLKYLSGASFKVVGATLEREDFSLSLLSVDLTKDVGVGSTCAHVPCDHCDFVVDHCWRWSHSVNTRRREEQRDTVQAKSLDAPSFSSKFCNFTD